MSSAPVPLLIPLYLVKQARLYAAGRGSTDLDAVLHVLDDYPRLVSEVRRLRTRALQLDDESAALDARLEALQAACRSILEL